MAQPTPNLTVHHLQVGQGERIPWLLEELSLPYTITPYSRSPLLAPPSLKSLHPMGASPVLEDATADPSNPLMLAESSAIADYLIHKYGNGRLALPPQHPRYADYLYWFHFANGNLQPTIFRRFMARQFGIPTDDARFKGADERVRTAVGWVDRRLRENEWLAGDEFTAADVMTVWCFTTMRVFEPLDLEGYEGILKWLERCTKREGYRRAMARGDPELDIGELVSVKGPKIHEALGVR